MRSATALAAPASWRSFRGRSVASGSMVGLRADMDALPLTGTQRHFWKSGKQGLMHGCGHDGHTAMLIAPRATRRKRRNFDGTAVLVFQPRRRFCRCPGDDGRRVCLTAFSGAVHLCHAITGLAMKFLRHGWHQRRPAMAAADRFTIEITGRGGIRRASPTRRWTWCYRGTHHHGSAEHRVAQRPAHRERGGQPVRDAQAGDQPSACRLVRPRQGTVRTFDPSVQEMVEPRPELW